MKAACASVIFQVADLRKSLAFYCEVLGFAEEFVSGKPAYYAGVKMGDVVVHLNASARNAERLGFGSVYVFCNEVDEYYDAIVEKGAEITSPLDTHPYGMRDFQTKDINSNLICFGCPAED